MRKNKPLADRARWCLACADAQCEQEDPLDLEDLIDRHLHGLQGYNQDTDQEVIEELRELFLTYPLLPLPDTRTDEEVVTEAEKSYPPEEDHTDA